MAAAKKSPKKPPAKRDRHEPLSKLHILIAKAFPEHRTAKYDVLDIEWLASKMGVSDEGVYTWLRANSLPMKRARQIVKIKGCRIDLEALLPFVS